MHEHDCEEDEVLHYELVEFHNPQRWMLTLEARTRAGLLKLVQSAERQLNDSLHDANVAPGFEISQPLPKE